MIGEKITLGINGHILETVSDSTLAYGHVGLYVGTGSNDSVSEVKFRDFQLFSLG